MATKKLKLVFFTRSKSLAKSMSAQEVGAWMLKEVGVGPVGPPLDRTCWGCWGGWKTPPQRGDPHFFFVGAKKFTTENNKSDGKFLGEPQAKFRGGY